MTPAGPGNLSPTRQVPAPRGPLSQYLLEQLRGRPHAMKSWPRPPEGDLSEEDLHLSLYVCYELHYRGFEAVSEGWEWEPSLLALRRELEQWFLGSLFEQIGEPVAVEPSEVGPELMQILHSGTGPSLSEYMVTSGTLHQFQEFAVHRSAYQLKEADPHTWAIPRLAGDAKAALVLIQADEYGKGLPEAMHAELFGVTMGALGLDGSYGAYLDHIPGVTLATVNLVSLFGLHRRWRGALVGHLAIFEMASVLPMSRYAGALRRLGVAAPATDFYDVHVDADALHQVVAFRDLVGNFVRDEPDRAGDVLFGARAIMAVEARFAQHLLTSWRSAGSSLRYPLTPGTPLLAGAVTPV